MRDILFRAWDKVNKDIIEIDGMNLYIAENKIYEVYEQSFAYQCYMEKKDVSERYIPLQFTGLKDKNGKEIYEGDIVIRTYNFISDENPFIGVVMFDKCRFWIDNLSYKVPLFKEFDDIGVIGNIYKNPELISV